MSKEFNKSIQKCIDFLDINNYLFQAGSNVSLSASKNFKTMARNSTSYKDLYNIGTTNQDFNFMMTDNSFFQFTEEENTNIRLVYYPNPYKFIEYETNKRAVKLMLDQNEITSEDYDQFLSEESFTSDIPLIRYDLATNQYCEKYHPAAHLHIGFHAENRWPVRRKLTPMAFMLKILIHYYPKLWKELGDRGELKANALDVLYRREISRCPKLEPEYFTRLEEQRLYLH